MQRKIRNFAQVISCQVVNFCATPSQNPVRCALYNKAPKTNNKAAGDDAVEKFQLLVDWLNDTERKKLIASIAGRVHLSLLVFVPIPCSNDSLVLCSFKVIVFKTLSQKQLLN